MASAEPPDSTKDVVTSSEGDTTEEIKSENENEPADSDDEVTNSNTESASGGDGSHKEPVSSTQCGNKVCVVCSDKALSCNFGAITCESCKAFFRRNAFKDFSAKCDKTCDITVETRSYCKRCRLNKCIASGMKVNLILSDEQKRRRKQKILENKWKRMGQGDKNNFGLPTLPLSEQDCYATHENIAQPYVPMPLVQHGGGAAPHTTYTPHDMPAIPHSAPHVPVQPMQPAPGHFVPEQPAQMRLPGIEQITKESALAPPPGMGPRIQGVSEPLQPYVVPMQGGNPDHLNTRTGTLHPDMPAITPTGTHSNFNGQQLAVNNSQLSYCDAAGACATGDAVDACAVYAEQTTRDQPVPNTYSYVENDATHQSRHSYVENDATPQSRHSYLKKDATPQSRHNYVENDATPQSRHSYLENDATPQSRYSAKRSYIDSGGERRLTSESSASESSASPWGSTGDNNSDQEGPKPSSADISRGGLLNTTLKVIRDANMFQTKISDLPPPISKPLFAAAFDDPVLKVGIPSFMEVALQLRNACLSAYDKLPENRCPSNPSYVQMFNFGEDTIRQLVILAKNLPPFQALCRDDQICLLKASVLHMMVLKSSMSYDPEIQGWRVLDSGGERTVVPNAMRASQDGRVVMNHYGIITISVLVASGRDMVVIALLIVLSLLSDNNVKDPDELQERHKVKAAFTLYLEFLRSYVMLKYPQKPNMFQDLVKSLDIVRDFSDTYINAMLKSPLSQLNPLLLEINDIMST